MHNVYTTTCVSAFGPVPITAVVERMLSMLGAVFVLRLDVLLWVRVLIEFVCLLLQSRASSLCLQSRVGCGSAFRQAKCHQPLS